MRVKVDMCIWCDIVTIKSLTMMALQEELHRSKEANSHGKAQYQKEIRRAKKENWTQQSAIVKLQEELKASRVNLRGASSIAEESKSRAAELEQKAFSAQYKLVGAQEEIKKLDDRLRQAESERDELRRAVKEEEILRIAAEGMIALPTSSAGDEFDTPQKLSSKVSAPYESEFDERSDLHFLNEELRLAKKRAEKAESTITFMKMECQFLACSCRVAESQETRFISDNSLRNTIQRMESEKEFLQSQREGSLQVQPHRRRSYSLNALTDSADNTEELPAAPTMDDEAWAHSEHDLARSLRDAQHTENLTIAQAREVMAAAAESSRVANTTRETTADTEVEDFYTPDPEIQQDNEGTIIHHTTNTPPPTFSNEQTQSYASLLGNTSGRDEAANILNDVSPPAHPTPATMSREAALAAIALRRGRAKSVHSSAQGYGQSSERRVASHGQVYIKSAAQSVKINFGRKEGEEGNHGGASSSKNLASVLATPRRMKDTKEGRTFSAPTPKTGTDAGRSKSAFGNRRMGF
jgi:hypothetical protein